MIGPFNLDTATDLKSEAAQNSAGCVFDARIWGDETFDVHLQAVEIDTV